MKIKEDLAIPFVWVAVAIPPTVIAIMWAGSISFSTTANANRLDKVEMAHASLSKDISEIKQDIAVIKAAVIKKER